MEVILIGKGVGWEEAPREGHTWGVHSVCLRRPVEIVFDMHKVDGLRGNPEQEKIFEYVCENKIPYITLNVLPYIPTSKAFPIESMPVKYCECSLCYMIFYAVLYGADKISLYGFNMTTNDEYYNQRMSVEHWIGYARGKGIEVVINEPTTLCKAPLYGYETSI